MNQALRVLSGGGVALVSVVATVIAGCGAGALSTPMVAPIGVQAAAQGAVSTLVPGALSPGFIQHPALSPDGSQMVFSWLGDLWVVPSNGGTAVRLSAHPASERRSAFSPDGRTLAFESDRDGARNLYVMDLARTPEGAVVSGPVRRVTTSDRGQALSAWTPDGRELLYTEQATGIYRSTRMRRAPVIGGPSREVAPVYGSAARIAPDGTFATYTRRRAEFTRPRYNGTGASDVWRIDLDASGAPTGYSPIAPSAYSEGDAFPLPDGSVLLVSTRDGSCNIWRCDKGGGGMRQLTSFAPTPEQVTIGHGVRDLTVSADGRTAAFLVWDTLMTLDLSQPGAQPRPISVTAGGDIPEQQTQRLNLAREVSEAALSPDGKTIAQIARGEVFVRSTDENWPTRRVTFTTGRERELAWSPDGRVLWFSSDQGGTSAIHYATVTLSREDLEDKPKAEEKKDEPKAEKPDAEPRPVEPKADAEAKTETSDGADKKEASGSARPAKETKEKKPDWGKRWAEGLKFDVKPLDLSFVPKGPSDGRNDGVLGMELRAPTPSPDGRKLLVIRGLGDMVLVDLVAKSARTLVNSWSEPEARWAADSRHIVYANEDLDFNSDIFLLDTQPDAQGNVTPVNLTRHPDLDTSPRLTSDGKVLYFRSERAGENFDFGVYAVFLDRKLEGLRPYELEDYFKKASTAAKARKPIDAVLWDDTAWLEKDRAAQAKAEAKSDAKKSSALSFDADDAWKRVRRISVGSQSVGALECTHAGDRLVISQGAELPGAESALVSVNYKGEDRKPITTGSVRAVSMAGSGGERVVFLRAAGGAGGGGGGATASAAPVGGGKVDAYAIDAPVSIDIAQQQRQKFTEASRIMGNGFYHPTLKGLNWPALTQRYASLAERTVTNEEFDRVFTMMLGELDGSHTGINGPGAFTPPSLGMGYLGVDGRTTDAGFVIQRVLEGGPADRLANKLAPGDTITHVDGDPVANVELANLMVSKAGREVVLTVLRAGQAEARPLLITPGSAAEDTQLRYNAEVERRRLLVERLSNARLGYLHIRGMSEPSVRDFERDLFAAAHGKDGLLIDVRDNGGGSTADILLASLTAPRHAKTQPRGVLPGEVPDDAYPRDRRLIYAYSRPLSVLINENSFSNAEIFAHAIRTTGRGTVVGTATYGGVISTGSASLIDGTTIRTPFRGWYLPDGTDMENNGARPNLAVEQVPFDEATDRDAQLEAAVTELLGRIGK